MCGAVYSEAICGCKEVIELKRYFTIFTDNLILRSYGSNMTKVVERVVEEGILHHLQNGVGLIYKVCL